MDTSSELRILIGVVTVVFGTGLAGSLLPAAEATIITTVVAVAVVVLVARILWWRVGEYRADRADAIAAATAARAAYIARLGAQASTGAVHLDGGRDGTEGAGVAVRVVA